MSTQYNISTYSKGVNGFGLPFCNTISTVTLAAATEATVATPGAGGMGTLGAIKDKYIAVFSYKPGTSVWVAVNETAAVPAGAAFAASTSELNPSAKYLAAGDVVHVISADASAHVSVAFYTFPE